MYRLCSLLALFLLCGHCAAQTVHHSYAIALYGEPALKQDFQHLPYVNADAPKQGQLRLAVQGGFDSLNPYIIKGNAAAYLGLIYDTLTTASMDEPFTEYGLIAESIAWPDDRSYVQYRLRPQAKFHDGSPITAEDVAFSFELLVNKASPSFKAYYHDVASVQVIDKHTVRFNFAIKNNRELPLIMGQLPVLPKKYWQTHDFNQANLDIPLSSGPYHISQVDAGKSLVFERDKNYWAKDLPINRGRYNFDRIRVDYYRDSTVMLEALKAHKYDLRLENIAKQWASAYTGEAIASGKLKKVEIANGNPQGMQAFIFNLRNPLFQDRRVRHALALAFDFEWANKTLFYNSYKRSDSFFSNSELASSGAPSQQELALLEPFKASLPASVFQAFHLPQTDGSGNNRAQLRQAMQLLNEAGWQVKNNQLYKDGKAFEFDFLIYNSAFERVISPFIQNLQRLGIKAHIKRVEISQYINQMRDFNFDMAVMVYPQSSSPGNEQRGYFSSASADKKGSQNYIGIHNAAVDSLVDSVIHAQTRQQLITACHALDRVLLNNWYVIPQYYTDVFRVAYWDQFGRPAKPPLYDAGFNQAIETWWEKP